MNKKLLLLLIVTTLTACSASKSPQIQDISYYRKNCIIHTVINYENYEEPHKLQSPKHLLCKVKSVEEQSDLIK